MSRNISRHIFILAVLFLFIVAFAYKAKMWIRPAADSNPQPTAVAKPASKILQAIVGQSNLKTDFELLNQGKKDLHILSYSTSCGCTSVKINKYILEPNSIATISVEASPFIAGERTVFIDFLTNDPLSSHLVFKLTMIGLTPPPFLETNISPLNCDGLGTGSLERFIWINTCEIKDSNRWLGTPCSDREDIIIMLDSYEHKNMSENTEKRSYRYKVLFKTIPPSGRIIGNLIFSSRENDGSELFRIPLSGTVYDPVYATPKSLYRRITKLDSFKLPCTVLTFIITSNVNDQKLELYPYEIPECLDIVQHYQSSNKIVIAIQLKKQVSDNIESSLVFKTNNNQFPIIKVPIVLSVDKD